MDIASIFFLSCALSADAFAVSLAKGASAKDMRLKYYFIIGLYFGGFQALMPLIGYFIGFEFSFLIEKIDHWISFILLSFIGIKMIKESRQEQKIQNSDFGFKTMCILAIATSIDALAIGVSFAFIKDINIYLAIIFIGIITFILCIFGLKIGFYLSFNEKFELKLGQKSEFIGGLILIILGFKILLEHLFF